MKTRPTLDVTCRHHWLLGQPHDGAIEGRCRKCGVERRFPAALDEPYADSEPARLSSDDASRLTAGGGARLSAPPLLVDFEA